uniref:Uncharacterized protein n=1 Tax=Anguilla anguilla TaxID=7936 RepID=A0A0E9T810_ANGAN
MINKAKQKKEIKGL